MATAGVDHFVLDDTFCSKREDIEKLKNTKRKEGDGSSAAKASVAGRKSDSDPLDYNKTSMSLCRSAIPQKEEGRDRCERRHEDQLKTSVWSLIAAHS
jgi:hypothetical protein